MTTPDTGFSFGRAIAHGVVIGVVAAALFYISYQAILRTMMREVESATRDAADAADATDTGRNGAGRDGLGGDTFGTSGSPDDGTAGGHEQT